MPDLATAAEVQTRLGRDLSTTEKALADAVIADATELIAAAAQKTVAAIEALVPVPPYLRVLCIAKALQAVENPTGVAARSKQLGSYQKSETFRRSSDVGVFLSEDERLNVRRAVNGTLAGSVRAPTHADMIADAIGYTDATDDAAA